MFSHSETILISELGGPQGDKEIIDFNIEFGLQSVKNSDPNTMARLESVTEFGSIRRNDQRKRPAICSYVGNWHLVVDVGSHEYGLRGCAVEDDSTSVGSAFVNDTHGKHFILDFENSVIHSPTSVKNGPAFVNDTPGNHFILDFENSLICSPTSVENGPTLVDNGRGLFIESDLGREKIVMDFKNSTIYMLSDKGVVTSIPRTPGFITAFGSHSAIVPDIDSSAGCKCPLPTLGAIAATDIPSFMVTGHEKEHDRLYVSTAKHHSVSTAGRDTDEGWRRKKRKLYTVRVEQMRVPGALSSEGNDYPQNLKASNVQNKTDTLLDSTRPKRKKQTVRDQQMLMPGALSSQRNNGPHNLTASIVKKKGLLGKTLPHNDYDGCSEVESNAVWASRYAQYFQRIGSMASEGETSSNLDVCGRGHPNPCLSSDHALANQVESLKSFNTAKRKQPRVNSFWTKKMRKSGVSLIHQNVGPQNCAISTTQNKSVSSMYVDIGDCQWSCNHCGARFWYGERLKGYGNTQ